jgi:predicted CoA-binding protein
MSQMLSSDRRVIILGASPQRSRFSNKAVRAYREAGLEVLPVHPSAGEVEGVAAYPSIAAVPGPADLLLLYVRPEIALSAIEEAARHGVRQVFINPGTGSRALTERIVELGMEPIQGCAIIALGKSPAQYPD